MNAAVCILEEVIRGFAVHPAINAEIRGVYILSRITSQRRDMKDSSPCSVVIDQYTSLQTPHMRLSLLVGSHLL